MSVKAAERSSERELAIRFAGAWHSRRIYAQGSPVWQKTLDALRSEMDAFFSANASAQELTVALLGEGLAIGGSPILNPPNSVERLASQLKARDVEIISLKKECKTTEIETLLSFLSADAADVSAVNANTWLRERGVDHIQIKHLKLMNGKGERVESFRDVFRMGSQTLGREFQAAATRGTVEMGPIMELSQAMLGMIIGSDTPIATLLALKDRDDFTYVHSVNVGMIAGCQAAAMGLPEKEIEEINAAGLLHDIGKTRVPEAILHKKTPLTLQEKALLAAHTLEGARLLYASQGANKLPAIVAAEHHRPTRVDDPDLPLLASQFVALADVFDSLRTLQPFDQRHTMRGALVYMVLKLGDRFSPYLLRRFATLCGMFEPGDLVHLSSGEVVKVVAPHPENALQPTVVVVDSALGAFTAGTVVDLSDQKIIAKQIHLKLMMIDAFRNLVPSELDALG